MMRNDNERRLVIGRGSWHLVEGINKKPADFVEGEFLNKDRRVDNLKYFKEAHF
jgi:hypothetical protein